MNSTPPVLDPDEDAEITQLLPLVEDAPLDSAPQREERIRPPHRRVGRWLAFGLVLPVSILLVILLLGLTVLNGPLTRMVAHRMAQKMACPGALSSPRVTIGGGRILPQLLRRELSKINLRMSDTSLGGIDHADLTAQLQDVRMTGRGTTHIGRVNAALGVGFAALPAPPELPRPTFGRAPDGSLAITVVPPAEVTARVKTTLLAKLELQGESINVVPQGLLLFGKSVPPDRLADRLGGSRTEPLPHLPGGLNYRSVVPRPDGLHIGVGGTVTVPFSELPATISGNPVSYTAVNGQLGISISRRLPLLGNFYLTIFTSPRIDGNTITLVPQSVEVFGHSRTLNDPIAAILLRNIDQSGLSRDLPALPNGLEYRSVSVDSAGIGLVVDGVAVKPYSELPATVDGRPTTYSAQDDLLAITTTGIGTDRPTPVVLYTIPKIATTTFQLRPREVEIFGLRFPASEVLATTKMESIEYPLQPLPGNLGYREVQVLDSGLRITISGSDTTLERREILDSTCSQPSSKSDR